MLFLRKGGNVLPWAALITVWIVWGSTYLAIRAAVATIPPLMMAGVRYLLAGLVLLAIVGPWHGRGDRHPTWRQLRSTAVIGGLMLLGGNGLLSVGERHLPSGLAALIVATVPVWMVAINAVVTRTRVSPVTVAALAMGTAGVAVLIGGTGGSDAATSSAVVVLAGSALWALGSVYARTAPLPGHPLVVTALEMIWGGSLLLTAALCAGELNGFNPHAVTGHSIAGLIWLIVPGSMLAFSAYGYANANLPNDIVVTYAYVNPAVAVGLGALAGDQPLSLNLLLGGMIIIGSVLLIIRARRASAPVSTPSTAKDIPCSPGPRT